MIITKILFRYAPLCILICLPLISACSEETKSKKREPRTHFVELQEASIEAVRTQLNLSGNLRARNRVAIHNEVSARIIELPFHPGDVVSSGDVIVRLDDSIIRAELEKALAQKKQSESEFERLRSLRPKQLASDEEITEAKTKLEVAIAEEKLQRARLARTLIRAPFDGIISRRLKEPGDVVSAHEHITSLFDPDSIFLEVKLAERWLSLVAPGDHVAVNIDSLGDHPHDAHIARIHPTVDETTRKGTIEIAFDPQPFGVRAGQLARASFYTRSTDRLVVPSHTLRHDSRGAYLYVLDEKSKARRIVVAKGNQYGDDIAILSGLSVGDKIIIKGFIGLRNGKKVTPVSSSDTDAS